MVRGSDSPKFTDSKYLTEQVPMPKLDMQQRTSCCANKCHYAITVHAQPMSK